MGFRARIKTSSPRLLNSWLLFVTVLVIVVGFFFYSYVYVKNNEKKHIDKRFRVLAQVGKNIVVKEKGFQTIVEHAAEKAREKIKEAEKKRQEVEPLKYLRYEIKEANQLLKVNKSKFVKDDCFVRFNISSDSDKDDKLKDYTIYLDASDFFEPLKRPDGFDGIIVLIEKTALNGAVLYHSFLGDIDISNLKELKKDSASGQCDPGLETGCLKDIKISNKNHKLFLQPIKLTPVKSEDKRKWFVGGLIEDKKFQRETRKLEAGIITPLFILFAIFILSIPLLKLCLMSKFEQLDISDVVLTYIPIIFGVIALILLSLNIFQVSKDTNSVQEDLKTFAKEVGTEFASELRKAYRQLGKYDSEFRELMRKKQFKLKPGYNDNIINILSNPAYEKCKKDDCKIEPPLKPLKHKLRPSDYWLFKAAFWMDVTGQQILQLCTRQYGGRLINVESRKYFQDAGNWRLPGKPDSGFMMQSITSMTSGERLAAISMKSNLNSNLNSTEDQKENSSKPGVAAVTTQLTSVIDTIIPEGYGFCIIDETGEVLFHSNTQRNLQENFIEEVENDEDLKYTIKSKQAKHLELDYQNMSHECYVMPLQDIPLYIVTFHDIRYTTGTQGAIILYTVFLTLILSLFNILHFAAAARANYRKSRLERKFDAFEWLRPLKEKEAAYKHLILSNILVFLFFIGFRIFVFTGGAGTFFLCASVILFVFTYNYCTITRKEDKKHSLKQYIPPLFSLVFLLVIDLIAWLIMDKFIRLLLFQVSLLLFILFIALSRIMLSGIYKEVVFARFFSRRCYIYFILSWLILAWLTPVMMFYIDAYNIEHEIAARHLQAKLAERIENRDFEIDKFYNEKMDRPDISVLASALPGLRSLNYCLPSVVYFLVDFDGPFRIWYSKKERKASGIYSEAIWPKISRSAKKNFEDANEIDDKKFNKIVCLLKPPMNRVAAERRNFVFPFASDKSRIWKKKDDKLYLQYIKKKSFYNSGDNKELYIESDLKYFKMPGGFTLLLYVIVIGLILILTYYLLYYFAEKIYGLNLTEFEDKKRTYTDAQEEIRHSIKAGSNLIIYCPTVNEMGYCEDVFYDKSEPKDNKERIKANFIDLNSDDRELAEVTKNKSLQIVLIRNFELYSNAGDIDGNLTKMNRVVTLLRSAKIQVAITTSKPLTEIIEFYEETLAASSTKEKEKKSSTLTEEMKSKFREIIDLLNETNDCLIPVYPPLKTTERGPGEKMERQFTELILKEFEPADYFEAIEDSLYRYYDQLKKKKVPISEEDIEGAIILKIQGLSQHYYNRLLNSCTDHEKYILYDIARDMLVNTNNSEVIDILLKKGLLVYDGGFKLMNKSFRNYILSSIDPDELKHFVRTLYPQWKSYKAPFLLIALGFAVFLAFQENLLDNVHAIITTAIGGIAIITKFSGTLLGYSLFQKQR